MQALLNCQRNPIERVEVTFRGAPAIEEQLGNVPLDDLYSLLSLAEDGNGSAAFAVFKLQAYCASVPQTAETLESAVNELYEKFRIPDPTLKSGIRQFTSDTDIGAIEQQMRKQFARCQAVLVSDLAPADTYLEMAAQAGTYPATLEYAQKLRQAGDDRAVHYFEMAWNSGDVNAAIALGRMYRQGIGGDDPDRTKAYAYTCVGTQLANAFFEGMSGDVIDEVKEQVEGRTEALLADFFPAEAQAATPLAKSILANNLHCCIY